MKKMVYSKVIIPELLICLEYTLPESTTLGGEHGIPDSSQPLPPLMHMGYAHAARHSGKNKNTQTFLQTPLSKQYLTLKDFWSYFE